MTLEELDQNELFVTVDIESLNSWIYQVIGLEPLTIDEKYLAVLYEDGFYPTRQEALEAGIKKANEIFENR
jgi:hypothetical protein